MKSPAKAFSPTSGGLIILKEMLPHLPPSEQLCKSILKLANAKGATKIIGTVG
ncbi:hypothetical protein J2S00_003713 [Caldalkalibacillus uzonensis]|uniref:Uncharacterized protein n=1 Tax=Caldalkalibacillus uzonensis TaxID=353224 RepID=A0ABU0CWS1_9BACI|nr:hypothetical protein [Caldalkalibacillus uzonensis]MDQ0340873.1 hypothetical protein [Caldalkalibacillus uzonensis]